MKLVVVVAEHWGLVDSWTVMVMVVVAADAAYQDVGMVEGVAESETGSETEVVACKKAHHSLV